MFHDFCHQTPYIADVYFQYLAIKKQLSNTIDLNTQSLAIKIVSFRLPDTENFFRLKTKSAYHDDKNLLFALGLSLDISCFNSARTSNISSCLLFIVNGISEWKFFDDHNASF